MDLARFDGEVDPVQGHDRAERLADARHPQRGRGGPVPSSRSPVGQPIFEVSSATTISPEMIF